MQSLLENQANRREAETRGRDDRGRDRDRGRYKKKGREEGETSDSH